MKNKQWFTFVELIVVVTILTILSTIGFISYSGYISKSRDASRVSQVITIYKAMESYRTKWFLPLPTDNVIVYASWAIVWYQWYASEDILNKIWYQDEWIDPKDNKYFTYYLTKDLRNAELMTFLEEEESLSYGLVNQANALDYTLRIPKVVWGKLWVLTESWSKLPIQEVISLKSTWLDIVTTTWSYTAYISDDYKISWTGSNLAFLKDGAGKSCKDILSKDSGKKWYDGVYYINPTWTWSFQVYCDMTTDDGGWTLVAYNNTWTINAKVMVSYVNSDKIANKDTLNTMSSINPENFSISQNTNDVMLISNSYSISPIVENWNWNWNYNFIDCSWRLGHTSRTAGCDWHEWNDSYNTYDKFNIAIYPIAMTAIVPNYSTELCRAWKWNCKFEFYLR